MPATGWKIKKKRIKSLFSILPPTIPIYKYTYLYIGIVYLYIGIVGVVWKTSQNKLFIRFFFIFQSVAGTCVEYELAHLLTISHLDCWACPVTRNLLRIPHTNLKRFGDKVLCAYAQCFWNEFPDNIKATDSVQNFKTHLKTLLSRK